MTDVFNEGSEDAYDGQPQNYETGENSQGQGAEASSPSYNGGEVGQGNSQSGGPGSPSHQQQASQQTLTRDDIVNAVRQANQQVSPQQQQRQISQEEYDRIFQVYRPNEDLVNSLMMGGEQALQAMQQMVQGISAHADRMAQYRAFLAQQELIKRFDSVWNEKLLPIVQQQQQQYYKTLDTNFYQAHPDLKDQLPLLKHVVTALKAEGKKFPTAAEAYKAVSTRAREIIASVSGRQNTNQQPNTRRMAPTSIGGRSADSYAPAGGMTTPQKLFG